MNIKTVAEKTGLTKKAIKYYESEGLINPQKNAENNYREYTAEDIARLNLIGALRAVEIPICEIKYVFQGDKSLTHVMKETLNKINETISNLEKSKIIINNIIERDLKDYESIGEKVKRFRETLEYSMLEKKEFISSTLLRIFPGRFGEIIVSSYKPFLNISIDNDEKRDTWLKLVEYLDGIDEVDENHIFINNMNNAIKSNIEDFEEKRTAYIKSLIDGDKTVIEQFKSGMINFIKALKENEEVRKKYKENIAAARDMMRNLKTIDNTFDMRVPGRFTPKLRV